MTNINIVEINSFSSVYYYRNKFNNLDVISEISQLSTSIRKPIRGRRTFTTASDFEVERYGYLFDFMKHD
jgi:hypothetical protein